MRCPMGTDIIRKKIIPATANMSPTIGIKNNNIIAAAIAIKIIITISSNDPIRLFIAKYTPNKVYITAVKIPFDFPTMDFTVIIVSISGVIMFNILDIMLDVISDMELRILLTSSRMLFIIFSISPMIAVIILIVY